MRKLKMIAVIAMTTLMAMPVVSALEAADLKEVKDITSTETANQEIYTNPASKTGDNKKTIFDIQNTNLIVLDENQGAQKPEDDAAWFGIGVEKPTSVVPDKVCWKRLYDNKKGNTCTEETVPDGQHNDYTLWIHFTAAELKAQIEKDGASAVVTKEAIIYWNGEENEENAQHIIVNLHASSVNLVVDPAKSGEVAKDTAEFTQTEREAALKVYNDAHKPAVVEQETDDKTDGSNPDTADINLYMLLGLIAVSGCGLLYTFKKRFN